MIIDTPKIYIPPMNYPITDSVGVGAEALALKKSFQSFRYGDTLSSFLMSDHQKFDMLASTWQKETLLSSSSNDIYSNQSYLEIIGMGKKALPYIFSDLSKNPNHWFVALKSITGIDAVQPAHRGDMVRMTQDWISWAKQNSFLS